MVLTYPFWQNRGRQLAMKHPSELFEVKFYDDHVIRIGKSGEPHLNIISEVRKNTKSIEQFIGETIQLFTKKGFSFTWEVTNHCEPSNMKELLEKHGFKKLDHGEHLVFDLEEFSIPKIINSKLFFVREESYKLELSREFQELLKICFPQYESYDIESVVEGIHKRHKERGEHKIIQAVYSNEGTENPKLVAFSNLIIMDENPKLAYLSGSATLPEYRNHGLYTNSISHRLQSAKENDCKFVYVGADVKSSAPILKKYGFKKVYETISYIYNQN
ncbi:MAG: GNAT family N-acetyltransferase [Candidatus Kariarchaeaceae archaeon]|jgi:N-acetylglutamate synthase-like GNAT family acetyltransferase